MYSRLEFVDRLKGLAIIFVVIGHFVEGNVLNGNQHPLYSFIYFFHMPLFIFISGYVAEKFSDKELIKKRIVLKYIRNKTRNILYPYFTWSLIIPLILFSSNFEYLKVLNTDYFVNYIDNGLWFLSTLFLLSMIFLIYKLSSNKLQNFKGSDFVSVGVLFAALLCILYNFKIGIVISVSTLFPFYFLGVFVAKYLLLERIYSNKILVAFFAIIFISLSVKFNYFQYEHRAIIKTVVSIVAIPTFYYMSKYMTWNKKIDKHVRLFGENSLVIYVTHYYLISLVIIKIPFNVPTFILLLISVFFTFIVGYTCIFISNLIKYFPIMNLIIYGRKEKLNMQIKENI